MADSTALPESYELLSIIYSEFVANAHAPSTVFLAQAFGLPLDELKSKLRQMAEAHLIVLEPDGDELRMAMPFSAVPTPFTVEVDDKSYWANCAWDALGVAAALGRDAIIDTRCAASGEPQQVFVRGDSVQGEGQVVHFAIPAAHWWDDVIET